jgi:GNAT superfamily N-acetyltransferase
MTTLPAPYRLSLDLDDVDAIAAHAFLTQSYWSPGIPLAVVERAIANSICASVHHPTAGQVAMARVVSDRATFAYLADVYVLDAHRGQGLAGAMVQGLLDHPDLQGLRRWLLFTRDAHTLYARYGYGPAPVPERIMLRENLAPYGKAATW